ncbi:MAG: helicase HerA-like domain-containing protein [Oscillospiraceae bacterium]
MLKDNKIWMAHNGERIFLEPSMANRHGLIAGATGTGKTITLKVMAESFSDLGVPVFLADVKGDLSGMCQPGVDSENMQKRIERFGIDGFEYKSYPTRFWDVFGEGGIPVRTTVSEMGPLLLGRLLGLNETQTGVLSIVFRVADDDGMLLLDMKDLRSMVNYVGEHAKEYTTKYGNISAQSVGAIQRKLLTLEDQGAESFFGEPALDITDWMKRENGKGVINVLHCVKLINSPVLYSTFLLWMLSELFEQLPEAGDLEKPKMVFFFDEASLLFDDAPKALLQKIEQTVKLIRSKGVGVYFVTQNPSDIPDEILAQLGNRVQHALRAYTPKEQKSVRAAAESFRQNPDFDAEEVITQLGTGEALVSFLDADGRPQVVQKANILPPQSFMKSADEKVKADVIENDILGAKYSTPVDRESAYELLAKRAEKAAAEAEKQEAEEQKAKEKAKKEKEKEKEKSKKTTTTRKKTSYTERAANKAMDTLGREVGKSLYRGLLGILKGK